MNSSACLTTSASIHRCSFRRPGRSAPARSDACRRRSDMGIRAMKRAVPLPGHLERGFRHILLFDQRSARLQCNPFYGRPLPLAGNHVDRQSVHREPFSRISISLLRQLLNRLIAYRYDNDPASALNRCHSIFSVSDDILIIERCLPARIALCPVRNQIIHIHLLSNTQSLAFSTGAQRAR